MIKKVDFEIDVKDMKLAQIEMLEGKEDSVLNLLSSKLTGKQKQVSGSDWRLIHDGVKVVALFAGGGITYTLEKAAEFATEKDALAEIERLNLDDSVLTIEAGMLAEAEKEGSVIIK